ncbi:hypothetical protein scyTo_0025048, partial [Scyliorhinus torazame]|nr:hypothetical protein [Scyliorhinus torazame]
DGPVYNPNIGTGNTLKSPRPALDTQQHKGLQ